MSAGVGLQSGPCMADLGWAASVVSQKLADLREPHTHVSGSCLAIHQGDRVNGAHVSHALLG